MSNVSDMKLKEWVVAFWKEGRLTPRKLLKDQKGVDRVWAWMKKFALNLASKGPICGFTTERTLCLETVTEIVPELVIRTYGFSGFLNFFFKKSMI